MTVALNKIVLVGLPGSGKSTVGALVATAMRWEFVDLDVEIAREAGMTIPEIFAAEGEEGFRSREHGVTERFRGRERVVIAPGGGWVLDPSNRDALGAGSLVVYLQIRPATAAARLADSAEPRPLLEGPEPLQRLKFLLAARESAYLQANHTVTVDSMSSAAVASLIVALASGGGGD